MGIFDWFKPTNLTRFDDCYAFNQQAIWNRIKEVIDNPRNQNKAIWIVVHFPEKFQAVQSQLETWGTDYEVVTTPIRLEDLPRSTLLQSRPLKLVLAELISASDAPPLKLDPAKTLAILMLERHPRKMHQERILAFSKRCPCKVEFGYFLSFDNPIIKLAIEDNMIKLLQQHGLEENDLISSNLLSRRLTRVLARKENSYTGDGQADSTEHWLSLYSPEQGTQN